MKKKLLIVDNNPNFLEVLQTLLKTSYDPISVLKGMRAVEIAAEQVPDLILLDIVLPEMNGIEIAHQIREVPIIKPTPILAMTTIVNGINEKPCVFSGFEDFIAKPFSYEELLVHIERLLIKGPNPDSYPKAVFPRISF